MKKDKRININDKNGTTFYFIFFCFIALYFNLLFFVFFDQLSFKTSFCQSCSGPLKLLNNPVPPIIWAALTIITANILPKIFRSDFVEFNERGKIIRELKYDNGDIYFGQVKDSKDTTIPHGKGILKRKIGEELKGIWKDGILKKEID